MLSNEEEVVAEVVPSSSSVIAAGLSEVEQAAYEKLPAHLRSDYRELRSGLRSELNSSLVTRYPLAKRILAVKLAGKKGRRDVAALARALGHKASKFYAWARVVQLFPDDDFAELVQRTPVTGSGLTWSHLVLLAELWKGDVIDVGWRDNLINKFLTEGTTTSQIKANRNAYRPEDESDEEAPPELELVDMSSMSPILDPETRETDSTQSPDEVEVEPFEGPYSDSPDPLFEFQSDDAPPPLSQAGFALAMVRELLDDTLRAIGYLQLDEFKPESTSDLEILELEELRLAWTEVRDLAQGAAERHAVALDSLRQHRR